MSFVEKNKAWLLPLLGILAAGVVYMNFQMMGKPSRPAGVQPPAGPGGAAPAPGTAPAPAAAPPSPPAPPPAPGPRAAAAGSPDLWSDLRVLEEPAPALNQTDALLKAGAGALKASDLHPAPMADLPAFGLRVPEPKAPPAAAKGAPGPAAPPPPPPPEVDFLIRNPKGASAWMGGSGFKEGQVLPGGWRVRKVYQDRVEVEGPGGVLRRWTNPVKARLAAPAPVSEAP